MRTTIRVSADSILIERALLLLSWRRTIPAGTIVDITCDSSTQSGNTSLYKIRIVTENGRTGIGSQVSSRSEAQHICDEIRSHLPSLNAPDRAGDPPKTATSS